MKGGERKKGKEIFYSVMLCVMKKREKTRKVQAGFLYEMQVELINSVVWPP